MLHVISDGKVKPCTEIGVALIRFSGYELGVEANREPSGSITAFGGFLFCFDVCSSALLVAVWAVTLVVKGEFDHGQSL